MQILALADDGEFNTMLTHASLNSRIKCNAMGEAMSQHVSPA